MTLFTASDLKPKSLVEGQGPKSRRVDRDRRVRLRIPTGAPRLVESATARLERAPIETWQALIDSIHRSALARLELLKGREGDDRVPCPWERLMGCSITCRCRAAGTVTVDFLRDHYTLLAAEIALCARPAPMRRRA